MYLKGSKTSHFIMKSYFYIFISSLNKTSNNIKIKVIWILAHFDPTFFQNQVKTNYRRDSKIQKALEIQIQCFSIILIHFSGPKISSTFCASHLKAGRLHYLDLYGGPRWLALTLLWKKDGVPVSVENLCWVKILNWCQNSKGFRN